MPTDPGNARSQRTRWELGRYSVVRAFAPRLLVHAIRQRSAAALEAFLDLVTPPLVNLFAFCCGMILIHIVAAALGAHGAMLFSFWWLLALLLMFAHLFIGLFAARADSDLYKALWNVPRYLTWKVSLYTRVLFQGRTRAWVRTTREGLSVSPATDHVTLSFQTKNPGRLYDAPSDSNSPRSVPDSIRYQQNIGTINSAV
jgi:hypothetical protein